MSGRSPLIMTLPNDVLVHFVFPNLSFEDVPSVYQTSKQFRSCIRTLLRYDQSLINKWRLGRLEDIYWRPSIWTHIQKDMTDFFHKHLNDGVPLLLLRQQYQKSSIPYAEIRQLDVTLTHVGKSPQVKIYLVATILTKWPESNTRDFKWSVILDGGVPVIRKGPHCVQKRSRDGWIVVPAGDDYDEKGYKFFESLILRLFEKFSRYKNIRF